MSISNQITHNLECTLQNLARQHKHKMEQLQREITIFRRERSKLIVEKKEERGTTSVYLSDGSVNFRSLRKGYTFYPVGKQEIRGITRSKSFDVKLLSLKQDIGPTQKNVPRKDKSKEISKKEQITFPTLIKEDRGSISVQRLMELATPKTRITKYKDITRQPESILTLRSMDLDEYEKVNGKGKARSGRRKNNGMMTLSAQVRYENTIQKKTDRLVKDIKDLIHKEGK